MSEYRNKPCPCGSGNKTKHCCHNPRGIPFEVALIDQDQRGEYVYVVTSFPDMDSSSGVAIYGGHGEALVRSVGIVYIGKTTNGIATRIKQHMQTNDYLGRYVASYGIGNLWVIGMTPTQCRAHLLLDGLWLESDEPLSLFSAEAAMIDRHAPKLNIEFNGNNTSMYSPISLKKWLYREIRDAAV